MKNLDFLTHYVEPIDHTSIHGKNRIEVKGEILTGREIYYLLEHIKYLKTKNISLPTEVLFKCYHFKSSDVANVIEIVMLYVAKEFENMFVFRFAHSDFLKNNIIYINSLLKKYSGKRIGRGYIKDFYKSIFESSHYRRVIKHDEADDSTLCLIYDEIKYTIRAGCNNYDLADEVAESTNEMVGNVLEHSQTDCVVDVKIEMNNEEKIYISLNVVSLSNIFIGDELMTMFDHNHSFGFSGSSIVSKAYRNHKKLFNEHYDYSAFAFVCSFQNTVSTRKNITQTGGTGFTTLIKHIHNKSFNEEYSSYILSGKNTIYFKNRFLNVDDSGIIGFNEKNDFYNNKPDDEILKREATPFPGTIFCVNLITEKIENENG